MHLDFSMNNIDGVVENRIMLYIHIEQSTEKAGTPAVETLRP
jgi:hypothetical protein